MFNSTLNRQSTNNLSAILCLRHGDKINGNDGTIIFTILNPDPRDNNCILLNNEPDSAIYYGTMGYATLNAPITHLIRILNIDIPFDTTIYANDYELTRGHMMQTQIFGNINIGDFEYIYMISPYYSLYEQVISFPFNSRLYIFSQLLHLLTVLEGKGYLINNLTYKMFGCDNSSNAVIINYFNDDENKTVFNSITSIQTFDCHKLVPALFTLSKQSIPGFITLILAYFFTDRDDQTVLDFDFTRDDPWIVYHDSESGVGQHTCFGLYNDIESALYNPDDNYYVKPRDDVPNEYKEFFKNIIMNQNNNEPNGFIYLDKYDNTITHLSSYAEILARYAEFINFNITPNNPVYVGLERQRAQTGGNSIQNATDFCISPTGEVLDPTDIEKESKKYFQFIIADARQNTKTINEDKYGTPVECQYFKNGTFGVIYIIKNLNCIITDDFILKLLDDRDDQKFDIGKYFDDTNYVLKNLPDVLYYGYIYDLNGSDIIKFYNYTIMRKYGVLSELKNDTNDNKMIFIKKLADLLAKLEKDGMSIGDFKFDNLGYDRNYEPIIIDYDSNTIYEVNNKKPNSPHTYYCDTIFPDSYAGTKSTAYAFGSIILSLFYVYSGSMDPDPEFADLPWEDSYSYKGTQVLCRGDDLDAIYDAIYGGDLNPLIDTGMGKYDKTLKNILLNSDKNYNGPNSYTGVMGKTVPTYAEIQRILNNIEPPSIPTAINDILINIGNLQVQQSLISELRGLINS